MLKEYGLWSISSGTFLDALGVFLMIRYYEWETFCKLSTSLCPNGEPFLSFGILFFAVGTLLIINGLFPPKQNRKEIGALP